MKRTKKVAAPKRIDSQAAMTKAVKGICNILRRDKAKGARLYVPELTWMLFLRFLDLQEEQKQKRAAAQGDTFQPVLAAPYRWRDWAAPFDRAQNVEAQIEAQAQGWKRRQLVEGRAKNADGDKVGFIEFVNGDLFPQMQALGEQPGATHLQKVVAEIFRTKERTVVASETNLQDALDRVHALSEAEISDRHMFPISQAFEGLLPTLGEKKSDGGQFFTPREVIRVIVDAVNPQLGDKVYDPSCGTGGFLIEAYKHFLRKNPTATQLESLKGDTLWGREDGEEVIPILLANLALHEVHSPRVWHGNTLTNVATYGDLWEGAPAQFQCILSNPPFGSKEGKDAQARFTFKCGKAQILFLQHLLDSLAEGGTCGMVIDEGVLFHTKTAAYVNTKRKLLDECDLWCVVSLPQGVFVNAGAGVKTDLLFFTKGRTTKRVWYYDMTLTPEFRPRKVNKSNPMLYDDFADFLMRLRLPADDPGRVSERSWWVPIEDIKGRNFDLKATNKNAPDLSDKRTPAQLMGIISEAQKEIAAGLLALGWSGK